MNNFPRRGSRTDDPNDVNSGARTPSTTVQSLGALLRERREAMGVTLAEIEVATRIRQKYLSALESDEWHLLPGEVVGRGFLRNYADYLELDPQEAMERRRALTEPNMNVALSSTSAGAPLPPERQVDYRPKEVELKDEGDGIQRGEIRLTPILSIVAAAAVVALGIWAFTALSAPLGGLFETGRTGIGDILSREEPSEPVVSGGVVNEQNLTPGAVTPIAANPTPIVEPTGIIVLGSGGADSTGGSDSNAQNEPGNNVDGPATEGGGTSEVDSRDNNNNGNGGGTDQSGLVLVPTATPIQPDVVPTATPVLADTPTTVPPTPVPTIEPPTLEPPTPEPLLPTDTPVPPEPVVAAPSCADARAVITSPGVNQVLSGVTSISGSASHEAFQYYKLEYAQGANAAGGFVYFDGRNVQINGALLGNFDTLQLPNGAYTLRLTVVDTSGNFPPPCDVSVVIQN